MSLVNIETTGAVRTVTLARPEKRNAINPEMMAAIRQAFSGQPPEQERVTVLRAEGTVFCSGLQLSTAGIDQGEAVNIEAMFDAVQSYPLPVVAIVQGAAIAGGCELALHCDFVIAAHQAPFAMPIPQLGVSTTWFLTKKIMEAAGPVLARELLLLGDPLSGERLHELGVIARTAPLDELDATAEPLIARLAANAPLSMRAVKAMLVKQMSFLMDIEHADTDKLVDAVYASTDAVEGVAAKVERRTANFTGR